MITAQEALALSNGKIIRTKFFESIEAAIKKACEEKKLFCEVLYWEPLIGDIYALYDGKTEEEALTSLGKQLLKELRETFGYTVSLSLYYEERQFVDMRLKFRISWN